VTVAADAPSTQSQDALAPIMAVSRAVAEGRALGETLATVARAGAALGDAEAAAIILRRTESATGFAVAGAYGLRPEYADELNRIEPIELGLGPSGIAAATRQVVVVTDVFADPIFEPWRGLAMSEGYHAMVSVPLMLGSGRRVIGALNAYRRRRGGWSDEQLELLRSLADHAAIATQTAQLLDESRRQVRGLSLVVRSLRTQSHEHGNLIHALYGLLTLDEVGEARRLIADADARRESARMRVTANVDNAVLSGFLLAEVTIAANAGIELEVEIAGQLGSLPPTLTELDLITVVGNLVQNAIEAVQELPEERRRVDLSLRSNDEGLEVRITDGGAGIPPEAATRVFTAGYTTKRDRAGVGLALVRSIVVRAGGRAEVDTAVSDGAALRVRIPAS
jgi:signal transduction histidine kinase